MTREQMEFDVVIVGAGPAGLAAACQLMLLSQQKQQPLSVCVLEKGAEVGSHILSGAILDTKALDELFPNWAEMGCPVTQKVTSEENCYLTSNKKSWSIPHAFTPSSMDNHDNYIISLGDLCRWLGEQAESLGVEIFPGFVANEVLYQDDKVIGVATQDMGLDRNHQQKPEFLPGIELIAKHTLFSEGCRGHLGKQLIEKFELDANKDPQHYAIGIKEVWQVPEEQHQLGKVVHSAGWPLTKHATGGGFLYHGGNRQVTLGLIIDLNYKNPHLKPFNELQQLKHHPIFKSVLENGERLSYGARSIAKGGFNSLIKMDFAGGLLLGCDAGTLNFAKIKGTHTAMKSGMLAAEHVIAQIDGDNTSFDERFKQSWLYQELYQTRNFMPAMHKFGTLFGGAFNLFEQKILRSHNPLTLHDKYQDHQHLQPAARCEKVDYPKPDGKLSFDLTSSVFLSGTNHEEDQPCHLKLVDPDLPLQRHLDVFDEPAQYYCPAGVYEIIKVEQQLKFQINAQNCLHCKTCDIKDPSQNIKWTPPEGGGGPNYQSM